VLRTRLSHEQRKKRPQQPALPTILRALRLHRPYLLHVILLIALISLGAVLGLAQPLLIREIIDGAFRRGDRSYLNLLVGAMVAVALTTALIGVATNYLTNYIGQRLVLDVRDRLYRHLSGMSLRWFTSQRAGETISRMNNDAGSIGGVVTGTVGTLVSNTIVMVTTLAVMLGIDWQLTLFCLAFVPLFIYPARKIGQVRRELTQEIQEEAANLTSHMQETLSVSGALLMKAFGRAADEARVFDSYARRLFVLNMKRALVGRWFGAGMQAFGALSPVVVYWYGGQRLLDGEATTGTVVAFSFLLTRLFGPAQSLIGINVTLYSSIALFERVFEYLDLEHDIKERPGAIDLVRPQGAVRFDHVSFSYIEGRPVLHDVSFEIPPGGFVALVGHSGAGKTTTAYLTMRLYEADSGTVSIDGYDVRSLTLASVGRATGLVTQETFLFHDTIRENLRYGRPDATDEEIVEAAMAANIHDFIMTLPAGYDTMVGERGYRLSGGEKQRVAIARALLLNPAILILDEATSSVDTRTERAIQDALDRLTQGRTVIAIAHRLSTILRADQILVFEGGRIVERGTHDELLALGGVYAQLYHQQFLGDAVEASLP
jgi:ATP-binding cassette subfamily B protein